MTAGVPDEEARREEGKRRADALRAEYLEAGNLNGWFEACYRFADGDAALVPWGHEMARPELAEWLQRLPPERRKGRALDIACGLGDNAAQLARAGFQVTAFDIAPTAIEWAQKRFPDLGIAWRRADLLDVPRDFRGAFDLVNETYTLQAIRPPYREEAITVLPGLVAPGGTLLVIARSRHDDEPENPPPWPLRRAELQPIVNAGLTEVAFEDFIVARKGRGVRHFRAEYRRE
ncbi:MAG: class I SAM-dependent methyltransferase [Pseudomonadota bacterium]|nr:class I SAM-dependent methyltransferase [Pseudomonadota bacterium]